MDVRCERCRAEYVIADEDVGEEGLAVRCAGCGHVFRVKRKAFVVTVPVKPEELRDVSPVSTTELDRRRRASEALERAPAGEGPVMAGTPAPVVEDRWEAPGKGKAAAGEPAWAAQSRPPSAPELPEPPRRRARGSVWPKLALLAAVLAAGAAVVLFRPGWLGLGPVVLPDWMRQPGGAPAAASPTAPPGTTPTEAKPAPHPGPLPAARGEGDGTPSTPTPTPTPKPAPKPAPAEAKPAPHPGPPPAARGEGDGTPSTSPPTSAAPPTPPRPPASAPAPARVRTDAAEAPPVEKPAAPPPAQHAKPSRQAAAEKTTGPKALLAEGRRLRDQGRSQDALDVYARALSALPDDAEALAGRGLCYLDLSQYRPAESSFEEALRVDAEYPEALMGLAETYRYEGRRAEAVSYYERYLTAHPKGRDAAAARSAIEALKE